MMEIPLSWSLGIDNKSAQSRLPVGAVTSAENVDIDRSGSMSRRGGYSSLLATTGAHDIWRSEPRDQTFAIIDGDLCRVEVPWVKTALQDLTTDAPFAYCDLNGEVVCGSMSESYVIDADLGVRRLGLEIPGAPGVSASASGGLDAGTYGVALSYLKTNEEGGLSTVTFQTLTAGQGLALTIPQPLEAIVTGIRIYRTQANGDVLHRATDLPLALPTYILGTTPLGRQCTNYRLQRMIPGLFLRYWKGLLWCVRNNVIYHSEPLNYGLYDPKYNFIQMANVIRVFQPVEGGIFVGTKDGMFFLSGNGPKEFSIRKLGGQPPIPGTGWTIPGSLLKEGNGEYAALWLSPNGFVVGFADGSISEPQAKRITLSGETGTVAVVDGRVIAAGL